MVLLLKCGDSSLQISATDHCSLLYRMASQHFSPALTNKRFVLYFISKRQIHVLQSVDKPVSTQQLRIRKSHDTVVHVLSEEIFDMVAPDAGQAESRVQTIPEDRTEDWIEIVKSIGTEEPTLQSFEVLQPISPNLDIKNIPEKLEPEATEEKVVQLQEQSKPSETDTVHVLECEKCQESGEVAQRSPIKQKPCQECHQKDNFLTNQALKSLPVCNEETSALQCPEFRTKMPRLSQAPSKYEVQIIDGLNIKMELRPDEEKEWKITMSNEGEREWPHNRIGLYNCNTRRRLHLIPKLPAYERYTLTVDCRTDKPLLLMEFQLGYEHHGELLLFGPIMRCILNLEEQAQHGS